MPTATLTHHGRITVPQEIRRALGLRSGARIAFHLRSDGVIEMRVATLDLLSLQGVVKPRQRGITLEDMERAIADGASTS